MRDKLLITERHSNRRYALQNRLQIYRSPAKIQAFLQTQWLISPSYLSGRNNYTRGALDVRKLLIWERTRLQFWFWNSAIQIFTAVFFGYIYCYVTITSFLTPPVYYKRRNTKCDDEHNNYSVQKMCPDVHFMCEIQVRMKLYRTACSLSDADSHFIPYQNNYFSSILSNKCTYAQEYVGTNVRIGKE